MFVQQRLCGLGDSSSYAREVSSLDDVVIVSALRSPLTKVSADLLFKGAWCLPYSS